MRFDPENYNQDTVELVYRISDVLQQISFSPYLQERLCFIGGSALNLVEFPDIKRLSVDLDFNFRQQNIDKEWKQNREKIDQYLKKILYKLKYNKNDIKINSSYPLTRFDIKFRRNKSFKIEIGYINRIPLFSKDRFLDFSHLRTDESCQILLPQREELFSSKCAALLSRRTPRDLFDVAMISSLTYDFQILRKCIILQNMMNKEYQLNTIVIPAIFRRIRLDDSLRNVLKHYPQTSTEMFEELRINTINFLSKIQTTLTEREVRCLNLFFQEQVFNPTFLGKKEIFHRQIAQHPGILRTLQLMDKT